MCCVRYALRNTLVAKDLEQASRIAYGARDRRFARVVTVAGQLIAGGCEVPGASVGTLKECKMPILDWYADTPDCV